MFLVTGGLVYYNTTSLNRLQTVEAFNGTTWDNTTFANLSKAMYFHCMVNINSSTLFLIGGTYANYNLNATGDTYFFDSLLNAWVTGPTLNLKRYGHTCGILNWINSTTDQMQRVIVVAGGLNTNNTQLTSVELLYLSDYETFNSGWIVGPQLPFKVTYSRMVELKSSVVMVGGIGGVDGRHLYKLTSPTGPWTQMSQILKARRDLHVTFLIPDSLTNCYKN